MAVLFALVATGLTSFLPILNKYVLRDARPALVAWIINAASLPSSPPSSSTGEQRSFRLLPSQRPMLRR